MVGLFGPKPGEGPARRYGPAQCVAVLSDAHANVPALEAVLAETTAGDLVVCCGDLTWGPEPARTVERVRELGGRAVFVRGNAERAVLRLAAGAPPATDREPWMLAQHEGGWSTSSPCSRHAHPYRPEKITAEAEELVFTD